MNATTTEAYEQGRIDERNAILETLRNHIQFNETDLPNQEPGSVRRAQINFLLGFLSSLTDRIESGDHII